MHNVHLDSTTINIGAGEWDWMGWHCRSLESFDFFEIVLLGGD